MILLHNPEQSLRGVVAAQASEVFAAACTVLHDAAAAGMCHNWEAASWDTRPLLDLGRVGPVPGVVMVRAGLLVPIDVLDASDVLMDGWGIAPEHRWGMSPFGRQPRAPLWDQILDPCTFLRDGDGLTRLEGAFRVAYNLPDVAAVAVGSDNPAHLRGLVSSLKSTPNLGHLDAYGDALRERIRSRSLPDGEG
ncbi:aldo/keto reductase [Yinghuangia sp. ASG 101]|uniref:aldo/keto reductase n=1 Tax=Yinghuangia sp. ASG 101 TaxID=2896848 RepID=UPI001E490ADE|nr:aldo/keto reductase [Yinghuangia sp. ASG 101]UGQ09798.1 aldo/keto reductase [Yinghuangia sp. ASG 101]